MLPDMQRCFTMFPGEWPGVGLLLLRTTLAVVLAHQVLVGWSGLPSLGATVVFIVEIASAALFLCGLWTPVAAGIVTLLGFALFLGSRADTYLLAGSLALTILMLGPGGWSIDARLFGRKQIKLDLLRSPR
jgi:putative oxidoreductase